MKIILRSEYKKSERRSPLIPEHAKQLVDHGFEVYVEESPRRLFKMDDYLSAGCKKLAEHSWEDEPADEKTIILGLKELPLNLEKLHGKHIYFAHIFKGQDDSETSFKQLNKGGGLLYDLEFLQNEQGRRVAAFGYWAGYVGAALGLWQLGLKNKNLNLSNLNTFDSQDQLVKKVAKEVGDASRLKSIIIGAGGRCGTGARDFFKTQNCQITGWDAPDTSKGGPFKEIIKNDIFVNCVYLSTEIPPFLDKRTIENKDSQLKVISDVSCDPNGPWNPIRVYDKHTSWDNPTLKVENTTTDIIAIDNLPSLLPRESSEDFSKQLIPYLLDLKEDKMGVWRRAENIFYENKKNITKFFTLFFLCLNCYAGASFQFISFEVSQNSTKSLGRFDSTYNLGLGLGKIFNKNIIELNSLIILDDRENTRFNNQSTIYKLHGFLIGLEYNKVINPLMTIGMGLIYEFANETYSSNSTSMTISENKKDSYLLSTQIKLFLPSVRPFVRLQTGSKVHNYSLILGINVLNF